jgi:hypothetical protein
MRRQSSYPRIILLVIILCLILGVGAGWVLAEQVAVPRSPSGGAGQTQERTAGSTSQFYKRLTGNSFQPVQSAMTYTGVNGSCIYRSSDAGYNAFTYDLQLPDGAEVNQVTFYYYDAAIVNGLQFTLKAYDGFGEGPTIATLQSQGWGGFGSVTSSPLSYVVDNFEEVLQLTVSFPDVPSTSGLQICGVLVGYQLKLPAVYLPEIFS